MRVRGAKRDKSTIPTVRADLISSIVDGILTSSCPPVFICLREKEVPRQALGGLQACVDQSCYANHRDGVCKCNLLPDHMGQDDVTSKPYWEGNDEKVMGGMRGPVDEVGRVYVGQPKVSKISRTRYVARVDIVRYQQVGGLGREVCSVIERLSKAFGGTLTAHGS